MTQEESRPDVHRLLESLSEGKSSAANELMPLVFGELRSLAARLLSRERPGHTLQPTELVNEAFLRLVNQKRVTWQGRTHFFAIGAQAMRRILVDHARSKLRKKRGQRPLRVELTEKLLISSENIEDVLAVDEALEKLAELDPRQARIVELRFFGGLTVAEVAEAIGVSKRTVEAEWTMVRAWLRRELSSPPS